MEHNKLTDAQLYELLRMIRAADENHHELVGGWPSDVQIVSGHIVQTFAMSDQDRPTLLIHSPLKCFEWFHAIESEPKKFDGDEDFEDIYKLVVWCEPQTEGATNE